MNLVAAPTSNARAQHAARWERSTVLLLCGLVLWRVAYVAILPLDLAPDEAYYWDWSRQLDWGYVSKPPLVAWIIAAATRVAGTTETIVRIPAALLSGVTLLAAAGLARSLFDERVARTTLVLLAAMPGTAAGAALMTIDAPFLCAWALALWAVWSAFREPTPAWWKVGLAIAATGMGLLAKQTMLAIVPLTVAWVIADRGLAAGRSIQLWVWSLASLAFLLPVAWWNAQHGWPLLAHTGGHFSWSAASLLQRLTWSTEFWVTQFGLISPVIAGVMGAVLVGALRDRVHRADRRLILLLMFSALPLAMVEGLSLLQRVQPNWPAPFYLPAVILLAAWATGRIRHAWMPRLRPVYRPAIAVGFVLTAATYAMPFVVPATRLAGSRVDPTVRLRGWRDVGQQLAAIAASDGDPMPRVVIAATERGPVSLLAFYLAGRPRVFQWNPTGAIVTQHDLWGGLHDHAGEDAVIVTRDAADLPPELRASFDDVRPLGRAESALGPSRHTAFRLWKGARLHAAVPGRHTP